MRGLVIVLLLAIGGAAVFLWETQTEEGPVPGAVDVGGPGTPDSGEAAAVGRVDGRVGSAERTVAPAVDSLRPDEPVDPRAVQAEPSEPVAAKAVRVRGRVFDWQGRPVAAAKVGASDPGDQILGGAEWVDETLDWVLTDSEGRFEVGLKEQGAYRLIARAAKFPREVHTGRADAAVIDGVVITLRRPGAIAGRVLGVPAEEGADSIVVMARPVADGAGAAALIDLGGLMDSMGVAIGSHTATVEADGSFEVEGLDPKRQYTVWAARLGESTAVGGEAGEVVTRIARGDAKGLPRPCTAPVTAQVEDRNVQLRYAPPTVVQFRVVDDATGAPIEGLSVAVGWMSVVKMIGMSVPIANPETLAQTEYPGGQVIVDRLPVRGADQPSNVAVQVSAPGYGMHDRENVEIRAGQNNDLGLIRLRRAPTVRVLVTAAGRPVRGARVSLRPEQEDRPRGSFSCRRPYREAPVDGAPPVDWAGRRLAKPVPRRMRPSLPSRSLSRSHLGKAARRRSRRWIRWTGCSWRTPMPRGAVS